MDEKKKKSLKPPWKPGQSGNPAGRPKNPEAITTLLREMGNVEIADRKTRAQMLAERLWQLALKKTPNPRIMEYVIDRLEGKPRERHEVSSSESGFLVIVRPGEKKNDSNGS